MGADTTPQDLAIRALNERFKCSKGIFGETAESQWRLLTATQTRGAGFDWQTLTLGQIVDCLSDAGLLSLPGGQKPQGDEGRCAPAPPAAGEVVEQVTEALKGYRLHLGPKVIALIRDEKWTSVPLSLGEMRDIAWMLYDAGLLAVHSPKATPELDQEVPDA